MSAVTGSHTVWVYVWEDDNEFNQAPGDPTDATFKIFGVNDTQDTADRSNNAERMFRPFQRGAEQIIEQQFEGSWSANFTLTNTWWLQFFYGAPTSTSVNGDGTAPWEHAYTVQPDVPPKTAHLIQEVHYPDGEVEQTIYQGCAAGSIEFDVSVEDIVEVSIDGNYATETTVSTADGDDMAYGDVSNGIDSQPSSQYRAMHFGNSLLRVDLDEDGTPDAKAAVQDASVSLEGNLEMTNELGTRFATGPQYLQLEPSLDYTNLVTIETKDDEKRAAYGSADASQPQNTMADSQVDAELEFDVGLSDETNSLLLQLNGTLPDDFSQSNVGDPQEVLEDDISRLVGTADVLVTSDQENPPEGAA